VVTVLVCNACRAERRLDEHRVTEQADVLTFCAVHQSHTEGVGFSLLLLQPQPAIVPATTAEQHAAPTDLSVIAAADRRGR
jgi:hypothetical protein